MRKSLHSSRGAPWQRESSVIPASVSPDGPAPAARTKAGHPSGLLTAGMRRSGRGGWRSSPEPALGGPDDPSERCCRWGFFVDLLRVRSGSSRTLRDGGGRRGSRGAHKANIPSSSEPTMTKRLLPLIPGGLVVEQVLPEPDRVTVVARSRLPTSP